MSHVRSLMLERPSRTAKPLMPHSLSLNPGLALGFNLSDGAAGRIPREKGVGSTRVREWGNAVLGRDLEFHL